MSNEVDTERGSIDRRKWRDEFEKSDHFPSVTRVTTNKPGWDRIITRTETCRPAQAVPLDVGKTKRYRLHFSLAQRHSGILMVGV